MIKPLSSWLKWVKMATPRIIMLFLLVSSFDLFAQNDQAKLNSLKAEFDAKHKAAQQRINNALQKRKKTIEGDTSSVLKRRYIDEQGHVRELIDVRPDGTPVYYMTTNEGAATTSRTNTLYPGGLLGLNLTGTGMEIGIWDAGSARSTHELFTGRVTVQDGAGADDHSTHVGGTMIGTGAVQSGHARGMAYNASLLSYDWNNDLSEVVTAIQQKNLLLSNHSYVMTFDVFSADFLFGKYEQFAADWDAVHYAAPFYLQVKAAGNYRKGMNFNFPSREGFDLITDFGMCKNNLVVAAVEQVDNYTGPASVKISNFSSYGPTDDGRVKPDISTKGVSVFSALADSDNSYGTSDGTSMASPAAAGSLLLLQQYNKQLTGAYLKAATLKGLIIHTADEAGVAPGPDYKYGWGLLNCQSAAHTLTNKGTSSIVKENTLNNGQTYTLQIVATSLSPIVVSTSWTDVPGIPDNGTVANVRTPNLVNDLDLRVLDGNVLTYYPWYLDPTKPNDAAKRGDNKVDNIEKVELSPTFIGQVFTVKVSHKGTLQNSSQTYSLIVTGAKELVAGCTASAWNAANTYVKDNLVSRNGNVYKANWWNQNEDPLTHSGPYQSWTLQGPCGGLAPSVSFITPSATSAFTGLSPINVAIDALDSDGSISKVYLKATDQLGTVYYPTILNLGQFKVLYTPRTYGTLIFTAVAIDNQNNVSEATLNQKVWETVTTPGLTIVSPAAGSVAIEGIINTISINAAGTVNKNMGVFISGVNFTLPEVRLPGEGPDYTYSFVPAVSQIGQSATLKVALKDLSNNSILIERTVTLNVQDNQLPAIQFISSNDTLLTDMVDFNIRVTANDPDGTISRVYIRSYNGNDFFDHEMTKVGNVWHGVFTPYERPALDDVKIYAVDNRGESTLATTRVRISGSNVNGMPVIELPTPGENEQFYSALPATIDFMFATYNAYNDGPEYIKNTKVFLDSVQIMNFDWVRKFGIGVDSSLTVTSYGNHTVKIQTLDERGDIFVLERQFSINALAPEISIVAPANEQTIELVSGATSFIDVDVNDELVSIDSVKYIIVDVYGTYANVRRFTVASAPFDLTFTPVLNAVRTEINAIVFSQNQGVQVTSTVYYRQKTLIPPTISIIAPSVNGTLYDLTGFNFTVNTSDLDGQVVEVTYNFSGTGYNQTQTVTQAPFTLEWGFLNTGNYTVTATAKDNDGVTTTSSVVNFIVASGKPTVYITSPANNALVYKNLGVNIMVAATDPDGTISQVQYRIFGVAPQPVLVYVSQYPYTLNYTFTSVGNVTVDATAYDNMNRVSELSIINLTVQENSSPSCTLPEWNPSTPYSGGTEVQYNGIRYRANYWSLNANPATHSAPYQEWINLGTCNAKFGSFESIKMSSVYPNPTSGLVTFETKLENTYTISIVNKIGIEVMKLDNMRGTINTIDLSPLSKGIYTIKLISADAVEVEQIVIQ